MVVVTGSLLWFASLGEHETFWNLLPGMVLGGIGMGAAMAPTTAAAMQSVSADKAGVGSAVLNSARQVGGSLGIAIMGAIVAASATPGQSTPVEFLHGFHHALVTAAGLTVLGAVVAAFTLTSRRPRRDEQKQTDPAAAFAEAG
jgi:MFS family permease